MLSPSWERRRSLHKDVACEARDSRSAELLDGGISVPGVLAGLPLPLVVLEPLSAPAGSWRCVLANEAFSALFGPADALGSLFDDSIDAQLRRVLFNGRPIEAEHRVVASEGERHMSILAMRAGPGLLVTFQDLTRDRALQRDLDLAREEAATAERTRMDFLATVSHELRIPLATIIGFAEIMKEGLLGQLAHPKYAEYVQDIFKAGKHLLCVLDDFLDVKRLEGVRNQSEKGYGALIDLAPDMICLSRGGRIIMLNASGADMLALWPASRAAGLPFRQFVHPDYRDLADDDMSALIGERHRVPMKFMRDDGREIDVDVAVMRYQEADEDEAVMVVARDITDRNRAIRAVLAREERLRKIMAAVAEAIITVDEALNVESINEAAERIFGYGAEQLLARPITEIIPGFGASLPTELEFRAREAEGRHREGHDFPIDLAVNQLKLADKRLYIAVAHDITRRKEAERHLRYMAGHDPLTGLPNRSLFQERLAEAIDRARQEGHCAAVLFVDLDNFKKVNDAMGHRVGDMVLQAAAQRLTDSVRGTDTVARLAGDEFTVIQPLVHDETTASAAAQEILTQLLQPFYVEGREIYLTASIGVALYPLHGEDMTNVLRNVDMAAHHAKRMGGNNFKFFTGDLSAEALRRAAIERGLRQAIALEELYLAYQPKIDLATGKIAGAEALLRWNSPELGSVPPAAFIPVAEETGLILPIGTWVIRTVCAQVRRWAEEGLPGLPISLNLSARQFRQPDLVESVGEILAETGIDPKLLELELTESMLVENAENAIGLMRRLKALGITLSIDDFGTGYSSLAYLKRFPVDALKIDRSFVKDIPNEKDDMAITCAIINLANTLQLTIVAEGIEKAEQAIFLRGQNCHLGQGYYYGKPIPAAEFAAVWYAGSAPAEAT